MKKSILYLMTACLSFAFIPTQLKAEKMPVATTTPVPVPVESAKANELLNRLNEINLMDKSNLNSAEKRALRKEVRSTKKQLKDLNGGVYLSVGAILIVLLLLILLL